MNKKFRITESQIKRLVLESVKRYKLYEDESMDGWYAEEDYDGMTGRPGLIRSYDVGAMYVSNAENDAEENGMGLEEYLRYWFSEIQADCPWYWIKPGKGYGHNGTTIFNDGGVVCKEIYDQIMFDEYPPEGASSPLMEGVEDYSSDDEYLASPEYLLDSIINGNWEQASNIAEGMDFADMYEWCRENEIPDELVSKIHNVFKKSKPGKSPNSPDELYEATRRAMAARLGIR